MRNGDAALMGAGDHSKVSAPGRWIKFLWALAAHSGREDKEYGVVNVQPEIRP
jgi:hypothetical protein